MDKDYHIAVIYQEPIVSPDVVSGFEEDIESPGLKVRVEPVPMMGMRASLEWLMPTAIVAYIAKPYFDSFLGEMGKDHYAITKKAFVKLRARIMSRFGDRLKIFASKNKLDPDSNKFSPVFSVEAQSPFGYKVKLLIQTELGTAHFNLALDALFRFMTEIYANEELSEQSNLLLSNEPSGSVLLVCFNQKSGKLEYVNPLPKRKNP